MDLLASSSVLHNAVLGALVLNVSCALSWQLQVASPSPDRAWRWRARVGVIRFATALAALAAFRPMSPEHSPWIDVLPFLDPRVFAAAAAAAVLYAAGEVIARRSAKFTWMAFPSMIGVTAGAIVVLWFFGIQLHFATGAGPAVQAVAWGCLFSAFNGLIAAFALFGGHLSALVVRRALRGLERGHRARLIVAGWCVVALSLVGIVAVRWIAPEHGYYRFFAI